jgi:glutamyl-tRNA synthetase
MSPTVRFAPSPTGQLHIGNARTALLNWLFAKARDGRFVLRLDDTDRERSTAEFAEGIIRDLAWLGIAPDVTVRQSDRAARHAAAAGRLKAAGRLYPCYETADELERRRKRRLAQGRPPVYDRAALELTDDDRRRLEADGHRPHWRFRLGDETVEWNDLCRGQQSFAPGSLSDPVLVREDGSWLYTLPSVVDDIELGISHVIRGEDHVANTAVQIELFRALGATPPSFAHHNLLIAAGGEGLSKRSGALSLASLREAGYEPLAIASLAVLIGSAETVEPVHSLDALAGKADLARLSRSPATFDPAELDALNARLLHETPHAAVAGRLTALGITGGAAFWEAVRPNLAVFADVEGWWRVVTGPVTSAADPADLEFLQAAAALLPDEPWDEATWGAWTGALKQATGRKGAALFRPLRLALTGLDHGPELKRLLPLIGREEVSRRLAGNS